MNVRGILVLYLNVGSLPPVKAEAFCDRVLDKLKRGENWQIPEDVGTVAIPLRDQDTRVDYISFEGLSNNQEAIMETVEKISQVFKSMLKNLGE